MSFFLLRGKKQATKYVYLVIVAEGAGVKHRSTKLFFVMFALTAKLTNKLIMKGSVLYTNGNVSITLCIGNTWP